MLHTQTHTLPVWQRSTKEVVIVVPLLGRRRVNPYSARTVIALSVNV